MIKLIDIISPEKAHNIGLKLLKYLAFTGFPLVKLTIDKPIEVMGLKFKNHLGLAAGLDKNGDYINTLGKLGFGFIEVGTVTPLAQEGNPQPRLFKINKSNLINRMGFNNKGVDYIVEKLKIVNYKGVLGVNIGKNKATKIDDAYKDYLICIEKVYKFADYITINISSPNTQSLRDLQRFEYLTDLLSKLKNKQLELQKKINKYTPIVLKIAPDLNDQELNVICDQLIKNKFDGICATNTTIERFDIKDDNIKQIGGLSGKNLTTKANKVLEKIYNRLKKHDIAIIGSGGVMVPQDVENKLKLGADLVQIYTGLVYDYLLLSKIK